MRFIHTADIHLDSPLSGLAARSGGRAGDLVGATRRAFTGMIDAAVERAVDFVVIAGDLYDGNWRDFTTGLFFAEGMARLEHAGIRVAVAKGNHDAENTMTRNLSQLPNVRVFRADRAETVRWEDLGVALHGRSYGERAMRDNFAAGYPAPVPGLLNIGVLHTAADGRPGHEPYAPCALGELAAKGYAYWALGHVHAREVLCERPWIVFPGNLQGRHANETGPKGFTLVTADDGEIVAVEPVTCDVVRWARVTVDIAGCEGFEVLGERVRAALDEALAGAGRRTLAVRLTLTGRGTMHRALVGDPDRTAAECEMAARRTGGDVWIEKVERRTAEPESAAAPLPDALGELLRAVEEVRADPAEHDGLRAELEALLARVPHAVRAEAGLDGLDGETLAAVLEDARAIVLGRLAGEGA